MNSNASLELLRRLQVRAASQMVLPGGQFFQPLEIFWGIVANLTHKGKPIKWIDCGAGEGHVTEEAKKRGIQMMAIDITGREGQLPCVMRMDAVEFKWSASVCPLICRPDHSGWALDAFEAALDKGACGFYVGLECNVERDLSNDDGILYEKLSDAVVGRDGEFMYAVYK